MSTTEHGSRSQIAAQRLRQMIVAGELAPGQRISEREIGTHLGAHRGGDLGVLSRTPLREALKILAAEGLVTIAPNCGATVTALSIDEVEEALELLVGLEGLAAEAACARIDDDGIAAIEALHAAMHAAYRAEQLMAYFELNQAIHQHIVDAAGNRVLSRIYAAECARIRRYRYAGNHRHERWDRAIAEHDQILAVLKERNGTLLRELLRAHHHNGWQVSRRIVALPLSPPPAGKAAARRRTPAKTNAPK